MNCPYAVSRLFNSSVTMKYNEDGRQIEQNSVESNTAVFAKCTQEECGAWDKEKNRCGYKG